MIKKLILVASTLIISIGMLGCGAKPIFKDENEDYTLKALKDSKLEEDQYYVKDNTDFYLVHECEGNNISNNKTTDNKRVAWTMRDDSLIPTMYSDGLIAYKSKNSTLTDVNIERFKDIGYSIGLHDAQVDADGYIKFKVSTSVIDDTSLAEALEEYKSYDIRIVTINDEPVQDLLNFAGVIEGLEQNETYKIDFYAGTEFLTAEVTADVKFYQSYEMYYIESGSDTTNGYISIEMPDDAKSGYYYINGKGMFRYYDCLKSEVTGNEDMNEAYYDTASQQISANSQAYVIGISQTTTEVDFIVEYETDVYSDDDIIMYLTAPNNESYEMNAVGGIGLISLDEAIAGKWTINIVPKDLVIKNVTAESNAMADDATKETYAYTFEEETNLKIVVPFTGEGDVWGTVTKVDDNTAYEFTLNKTQLECTISYVSPGDYVVDIYHYADTQINEPEISYDDDTQSEDVIIVESD